MLSFCQKQFQMNCNLICLLDVFIQNHLLMLAITFKSENMSAWGLKHFVLLPSGQKIHYSRFK